MTSTVPMKLSQARERSATAIAFKIIFQKSLAYSTKILNPFNGHNNNNNNRFQLLIPFPWSTPQHLILVLTMERSRVVASVQFIDD